MVCRNIPQGAADSFETLPEMHLGLGVRRDASTGVSQGATPDVPAEGIDLSVLRNQEAQACFDRLIRSNPSLLSNTATALQIIRHFQNTDRTDPNHITWGELTRDYEANAEAVATQLNAYLGLVTFLSQSSTAPVFPAHGPAGGTCPNVTPQTLSSYEDLTQAYVGLGVDRHPASGVARRPLPVTPQTGLDLSILEDAAAVACLENMARNSPALMQDLHRVQQILRDLRERDSQRDGPNTLTVNEIQNLYGDNAGHALVSINAYLGLLRHVGGQGGSQGSGVNPWAIAAGVTGAFLIGGLAYLGLRNRGGSTEGGGSFDGADAIERQLREMQEDASEVQPRPAEERPVDPAPRAEASPPPPPPPPPLPETFVKRGIEAIRLPIPRRGGEVRFTLGRWGTGDHFVSIPSGTVDVERAFVSNRHAEIHRDRSGTFSIRDLGSLNGTTVYREDAAAARCDQIEITNAEVPLRAGDIIRIGRSYYRFTTPAVGPVLQRMGRSDDVSSDMRVVAPDFAPERPMLERLREAQRDGIPRNFYMLDSKSKYAGRIVDVDEAHGTARIRDGRNHETTVRIDQIVTLRGRLDADNLTSRYSRVPVDAAHPGRFADMYYNDMAMMSFQVMVDYADPRLAHWLDNDVHEIRERLDRGDLNQQQAAEEVWRLVREHIPYDESRYRNGQYRAHLPNQLFRLGDFLQTGVCNERGMLVQVALQYLGIESRFVIGDVPGGRHAWVRATIRDERGRPAELLLDPQERRVYRVGRDDKRIADYTEESARSVQQEHHTMLVGDADRHFGGYERFTAFGDWSSVMDRPLDSAHLEEALRAARPELADYFRRYVRGTEGMPFRTVRDLVMAMGNVDNGSVLREAYQTATRGGRPIGEVLETAIFELVARGAQDRNIWFPTDVERQAASQAFQREMTPMAPPAGGVERPIGSALNRFRADTIPDGDFYRGLMETDPEGRLARTYRALSPETRPVRNVGELLDLMEARHPGLTAGVSADMNRLGLSLESSPWRVLFEMTARAATADPQGRIPSVRATEVQERLRLSEGFERDLIGRRPGIDPVRPAEDARREDPSRRGGRR